MNYDTQTGTHTGTQQCGADGEQEHTEQCKQRTHEKIRAMIENWRMRANALDGASRFKQNFRRPDQMAFALRIAANELEALLRDHPEMVE